MDAVESTYPSREAVAQAGAQLAQRLGLEPDQALDKVVSAVLQGFGGGSIFYVLLAGEKRQLQRCSTFISMNNVCSVNNTDCC